MNNKDNSGANIEDLLQSGLRDIERLVSKKDYNLVMIKARQVLEHLVNYLADSANIQEATLSDRIDALYEDRVISKEIRDHYHTIRILGNNAVHEGDKSSYNANQAYRLLSKEIISFSDVMKVGAAVRPKQYAAGSRSIAQQPAGDRHHTSGSRQQTAGSRQPSSAGRHQTTNNRHQTADRPGSGSRRSTGQQTSRNSRRHRARKSGLSIDPGSLLKPLLLIAIIVVLVFIIKMIRPAKEKDVETTPAITSTTEITVPETTAPESTEPESTTAAAVKYRVTDTINVRPKPSTDDARIGVLDPGTEVEFVRDEDEKWCVIIYNGKEAYVVKEYLTPVS